MKLRLKQEGFETYSGQMGVVFFENGLSVGDVRVMDGVRMAAVMLCEWEDGSTASVAQSLLDHAHTPAPVFTSGADGQHDREREEGAPVSTDAAPAAPAALNAYTADELGAIADKSGIKGLREIGDPLGLKANSIKDLIDAILRAGAAKA